MALVARAIRSGVFNDLGSGSNVDLCIITAGGTEYLRNHEFLQVRARACVCLCVSVFVFIIVFVYLCAYVFVYLCVCVFMMRLMRLYHLHTPDTCCRCIRISSSVASHAIVVSCLIGCCCCCCCW